MRTDNGRGDAGLGSHPARTGKKAVVEAAPVAQALAAVVKEHPRREDELQIHGALHGCAAAVVASERASQRAWGNCGEGAAANAPTGRPSARDGSGMPQRFRGSWARSSRSRSCTISIGWPRSATGT